VVTAWDSFLATVPALALLALSKDPHHHCPPLAAAIFLEVQVEEEVDQTN
jgi:hypothetical protein